MKLARNTRESLIGPLVLSAFLGCLAAGGALVLHTDSESSSSSQYLEAVIAFLAATAGAFFAFGLLPVCFRSLATSWWRK